jgi:hypothetical protein
VAAGVAAVAVVALQQRAVSPALRPGTPLTAQLAAPAQSTVVARSGAVPGPREAISYTVPTSPAAPAAIPPARLTNYMFAHSRYSSGLALRGVVANLLTEADDQQPAVSEAAAPVGP